MGVECFKADLHIHTCLSPCGHLEMSPRKIVESALERGLDIIAITDHNTTAVTPESSSASVFTWVSPLKFAFLVSKV
jgi:predicted metal-dependent phosphoesterase TrpH